MKGFLRVPQLHQTRNSTDLTEETLFDFPPPSLTCAVPFPSCLLWPPHPLRPPTPLEKEEAKRKF